MAELVQTGKYGTTNTKYKTAMGYYVINFFSVSYKLQEDKMCDGQTITAGELDFKEQYTESMKNNTNW